MSSLYWVIGFLFIMFLVPWLFERYQKAPTETQPLHEAKPKPLARRGRRQRRRNLFYPGETFPEYDLLRNEKEEWTTKTEVGFRDSQGYPPDWERRRALAFLRWNGRCQNCGAACGRLACEPEQIWNFKHDAHLLYNADVHHLKRRARGGNHDLTNLALYCLRCHSEIHPENSSIWARRVMKGLGGGNAENLYRRKAPKPPDTSVPF